MAVVWPSSGMMKSTNFDEKLFVFYVPHASVLKLIEQKWIEGKDCSVHAQHWTAQDACRPVKLMSHKKPLMFYSHTSRHAHLKDHGLFTLAICPVDHFEKNRSSNYSNAVVNLKTISPTWRWDHSCRLSLITFEKQELILATRIYTGIERQYGRDWRRSKYDFLLSHQHCVLLKTEMIADGHCKYKLLLKSSFRAAAVSLFFFELIKIRVDKMEFGMISQLLLEATVGAKLCALLLLRSASGRWEFPRSQLCRILEWVRYGNCRSSLTASQSFHRRF